MLFLSLLAAMLLDSAAVTTAPDSAKVDSGFVFTTVDSVGITPVKDQHRSGTCWAFSTIGFFESEVMRVNNGKQVDLSEMFVVNKTMMDRAE